MHTKFVLLRTTHSSVDATLIQGFLLSHEIQAQINTSKSQNSGGAHPFPFSGTAHGIEILVDGKDLEKAKKILKEAKL